MYNKSSGYLMVLKKLIKPGRPARLTLDHVMSAALKIANEDGLSALTVRGVARVCKVTPMAIYRHVDSVKYLEELAFRKAMQSMPQPDLSGNWREKVKSIWRNFRQMLHANPGAAAVFAKRAMPTPEIIQATNQLLEILEAEGFTPDQAFQVYDITFIYTLGSIRFELTRAENARRKLVETNLRYADLQALSRHASQMANRDADKQFEAGLDVILRGLSC